jgi:hypothetical protein
MGSERLAEKAKRGRRAATVGQAFGSARAYLLTPGGDFKRRGLPTESVRTH